VKKILIAPDSFKGTLSAKQVADVIAAEVTRHYPRLKVEKLPVADGGEGSVEVIVAAVGGTFEYVQVQSPDNRNIKAYFGVAADNIAVLEIAQSTGITRQVGLHPMTSSTYGFGQLIVTALNRGLRNFFLCIGGSASTDAGCGMAAALGVQFLDSAGQSFVPSGATLHKIVRIDVSDINPWVKDSTFTVLCDVDNPLYGESGAAYVYSPQKGANSIEVCMLDQGLRHVSEICKQTFGSDYAAVPGAGAAGGLGFGSMVFLGGNLRNGIDTILSLCNFEKHFAGADLIITGEGKLDNQSFSGKVLSGILHSSGDVPIVSICGINDASEDLLCRHGITVFEISKGSSVEESLKNPEVCLKRVTKKMLESKAFLAIVNT